MSASTARPIWPRLAQSTAPANAPPVGSLQEVRRPIFEFPARGAHEGGPAPAGPTSSIQSIALRSASSGANFATAFRERFSMSPSASAATARPGLSGGRASPRPCRNASLAQSRPSSPLYSDEIKGRRQQPAAACLRRKHIKRGDIMKNRLATCSPAPPRAAGLPPRPPTSNAPRRSSAGAASCATAWRARLPRRSTRASPASTPTTSPNSSPTSRAAAARATPWPDGRRPQRRRNERPRRLL